MQLSAMSSFGELRITAPCTGVGSNTHLLTGRAEPTFGATIFALDCNTILSTLGSFKAASKPSWDTVAMLPPSTAAGASMSSHNQTISPMHMIIQFALQEPSCVSVGRSAVE